MNINDKMLQVSHYYSNFFAHSLLLLSRILATVSHVASENFTNCSEILCVITILITIYIVLSNVHKPISRRLDC